MNLPIVQSTQGVTLAGGGPFSARDLALALKRAPVPVAADSGADRLLNLGAMPEAVIGDMDSISTAARARIPVERQHLVHEGGLEEKALLEVVELGFFVFFKQKTAYEITR